MIKSFQVIKKQQLIPDVAWLIIYMKTADTVKQVSAKKPGKL